jgi:carbamoylphosphate synthase small subunit
VPLPDWLRAKGVVAIEGIDTRMLTKRIRTEGCLRAWSRPSTRSRLRW